MNQFSPGENQGDPVEAERDSSGFGQSHGGAKFDLLRPLSVGIVVLAALAVRLFNARRWNASRPNGPERLVFGDEPSYNAAALQLLEGFGFPSPDRTPLYPSWIALLHWLSGESYNVIPYAQALIGAATVLLTYLLGRKIFGHVPGLLAAGLAATSFVLIRQSVHVLTEVLFTPALLMVVLSLWRAMDRPSTGRFAWAAGWVGIANLIRPTLLFFPFFVAPLLIVLWRSRESLRFATVFVVVAMLVIAPWTVHNYVRHEAFLPLATSNATLWLGSPEYYRLTRHEGYTYFRIWDEVIYPGDPTVPYPVTIAGDRYWSERAIRSIRAEPLVYIRFAMEKAVTYWTGDPNADWADTYVFNYWALRGWGYSHLDAMQLMVARILPFVALLAALHLRQRWRSLLPIFILILYCNLLHAATVARARMSEPLQPFLLVLIAAAAVQLGADLLDRYRSSRLGGRVAQSRGEPLALRPANTSSLPK
jgi:4-amino-4-deoxy-L-arabinose transferase-like glycosyltransferase